jgi:hypothetical protein
LFGFPSLTLLPRECQTCDTGSDSQSKSFMTPIPLTTTSPNDELATQLYVVTFLKYGMVERRENEIKPFASAIAMGGFVHLIMIKVPSCIICFHPLPVFLGG